MPENIDDQESNYLTPIDVGLLLSMSPIIVRKMVQDGKLKTVNYDPGGPKYFLREEVERFACQYDITLFEPKEDFLKVLIIDDDTSVTSYLMEFLNAQDHKIKAEYANNAEEAHSKIKSFKPHIVLLDIMMPDLDGFDICNLLKLSPLTRSIRVIAITGCNTKVNRKIILDSGAEECLSKPINSQKLLDAIGLK